MFLDTNLLIEYLIGSPRGARVKEVLAREPCSVSAFTAAELVLWCLREGHDPALALQEARRVVDVVIPGETVFREGARITHARKRQEKSFGLMDGLILAGARDAGEALLTADSGFRGMEGVEVV
ncbi:MAG: PIN domain-containing protein [Halobacteria archaeon]